MVAFAGPFAYPAAILARALGDDDRAGRLAETSLDNARRLGARTWTALSERLLAELVGPDPSGARDPQGTGTGDRAELTRNHGFWTVSWRGEQATIPDLKGINDIVALVGQPGTDVPALQLVSGIPGHTAGMIDMERWKLGLTLSDLGQPMRLVVRGCRSCRSSRWVGC